MKKLITYLKVHAFAVKNLAKKALKKDLYQPGCEDILFV
jgi:hypothetical protein